MTPIVLVLDMPKINSRENETPSTILPALETVTREMRPLTAHPSLFSGASPPFSRSREYVCINDDNV